MGDLEMALAAIAGLGTPSVEDQFKAAGLLDDLGLPSAGDPYSYSSGRGIGYLTTPDGAPKSSIKSGAKKTGTAVKDALGTALGFADELVTPAAKRAQFSALNRLGGVGTGSGPMASISRFAASPKALMLAKVGTGIGALGGVMGAADVLAGNDSAGNKIMDTGAMTIGGILGAAGGPIGIMAGAGIGKAASDATQFILGGGMSAEERRMVEALAALRGGQI